MKKFFLLSFILFFVAGTTSFAQNNLGVVGKIISESQATQLFGDATKSFHISHKQLSTFAMSTDEYLLVGFKDNGNSLCLLNDKRKGIYPSGYIPGDNEVYFVFSVSMINELLSSGVKKITVELRQNGVLTILAKDSNNNGIEGSGRVLEFSLPCPPMCPH